MIEAQKPAEGIYEISEGLYGIPCSCGNDNHALYMNLSTNEFGEIVIEQDVCVSLDNYYGDYYHRFIFENTFLYAVEDMVVKYYNIMKYKLSNMYKILMGDEIKLHSEALLSKQQAVNYANLILEKVNEHK